MYKYTKLYEIFLNVWNKKKNECVEIECFFNIPGVIGNTFRNSKEITSSPLYDIGCYIISLLVDLKISLENLKIHNINIQNNKIINLFSKGVFKKMKIYAEFGMGKEYKNQVKLKFQKDFKIVFDKFFFGVEAEKQIIFEKKNRKRIFFVKDVNGFKKIFEYSNSFWLKNQRERFEKQALAKAQGDEDAMMMNEEYLAAMEHGMPCMSGWGMGIDRLVTLLTGQDNLKDSVLSDGSLVNGIA